MKPGMKSADDGISRSKMLELRPAFSHPGKKLLNPHLSASRIPKYTTFCTTFILAVQMSILMTLHCDS